MTRPKIPHGPPKRTQWLEDQGDALRWVRKLAERGKLSGRSVSIPHYGRTDAERSFQPPEPAE